MSDLPKGWKEERLSELVDKIIDYRGKTPKKLGLDWSEKGKYRALSAKSVKTGGLVNEDQINLGDENLYKAWMKDEIEYNDILLTSEAPMGEVIIWKSEEKIILSQRLFAIRIKENISPDYMYYYFISKTFQSELLARASGTTVVGIKQTELLKTNVVLPESPDEQKEIASVLSSFDKKIELLKEQNKTLETMAQTIFKEWFVDFNHPNTTGEMCDSEMGEIPKGWRVGKIGDEFDITIGRTPPRQESQWFSETPQGMKWASIKDMGNAGLYIFNTSEYIVDEAVIKFNIPIIPENTTILSFKMTVGKVSITTEKMLSNEAIAHMKIKNDSYLTSEYIYLFLLNLNFNTLGSTSSIVTAINTAIIKKIRFLVPDKMSMNNFSSLIIPIFRKIKNNYKQIKTLENTRDNLLPKLVSGEIRVEV